MWEELPEPLPEFAVDLGLPSGRLWADRNVGAATPEAYGDYFMWGSVTPDTNNVCDWAHAPFNDGATALNKTYFNSVKDTVCPNGTLASEYDAAHAIMGDSWRMPTSAEIQELLDGTTRSNETLNGISGKRFTSKTNGNSIFMPFAGRRDGSDVVDVGDYGYAWSSSLYAGDANLSRGLGFNDDGNANVNYYYRYVGFSVRGVC